MDFLDKKHRDIAISNLTKAFGDEKSPYEISLLAKRVFANLCRIIFEIGWSLRLTDDDLPRHFSIEGEAHYRAASEKGKGVLLLTAHMGNWELSSVIAKMTGFTVNVLFRPLDFFPLDRLFLKLRGRFGPEVVLIKTGDKTKDLEENTRAYNLAIESIIRRYPEQWFWVHQRYKTRPYQPWPR
ncbi:lysophospholipid acyltransferase family protein [Thermodesulfobacteriota bacterium]